MPPRLQRQIQPEGACDLHVLSHEDDSVAVLVGDCHHGVLNGSAIGSGVGRVRELQAPLSRFQRALSEADFVLEPLVLLGVAGGVMQASDALRHGVALGPGHVLHLRTSRIRRGLLLRLHGIQCLLVAA